MNKKTRGFTLIELLVVIAIIGILSSVVLASLNSARAKGAAAKMKAQMAAARAAAELYYDSNGGYGVAANCTTAMFADSTSGMASYTNATNYTGGTATFDCGSTATAYSMATALATSGGTYVWCIDSTGVSRDKTSTGVTYTALTGTVAAGGAHSAAGATTCQ